MRNAYCIRAVAGAATAGFALAVAAMTITQGCSGGSGRVGTAGAPGRSHPDRYRTGAAVQGRRLTRVKSDAAEMLGRGDPASAARLLEDLSRTVTSDSQLYTLLGRCYEAMVRRGDAIASYENAIRARYEDGEAHRLLATLLMRMGKTGRALAEYEAAVRVDGDDGVTRYNYAVALRRLGKKRAALVQAKAAAGIDESSADYAALVGVTAFEAGDPAVLGYFENAEKLGANGAMFWNNYGLVLQSERRFGPARSRFEGAVSRSPGNEQYRYNLAAALLNAGDDAAAVAVLDTLAARFGSRWSYRVNRGRAYLRMGRPDEAAELVAAALRAVEGATEKIDRTPPSAAEAKGILAMSYRGLGRLALARETMRGAVDEAPRDVALRNNYGVILAESDMIARALEQWERVLEIEPLNPTALRNITHFSRTDTEPKEQH